MDSAAQRRHVEREAAKELVKRYGAPGETGGVVGEPHHSATNGLHHDVYSIAKGADGKIGQPVISHIPSL